MPEAKISRGEAREKVTALTSIKQPQAAISADRSLGDLLEAGQEMGVSFEKDTQEITSQK